MYFKIHVYKYYFYNNQKTKFKPYWNLKTKHMKQNTKEHN